MSETPEAPASMNVRFASTLGYEYLLTIRSFADEKPGGELLHLIPDIETTLQKLGCRPIFGRNSQASAQSVDDTGPEPEKRKDYCYIHQCEMRKWEKDGRSWYSHAVELPDGTTEWCNGKEKK